MLWLIFFAGNEKERSIEKYNTFLDHLKIEEAVTGCW
jgi:hypothetical protein